MFNNGQYEEKTKNVTNIQGLKEKSVVPSIIAKLIFKSDWH